jgi:hypothetical protein
MSQIPYQNNNPGEACGGFVDTAGKNRYSKKMREKWSKSGFSKADSKTGRVLKSAQLPTGESHVC